MQTPWGNSQSIEKIAEGFLFIDTASQGGIKVSSDLNMMIPDWLKACTRLKQGIRGWYEENVDSCIPVLFYANQFKAWAKSQGSNPEAMISRAKDSFVKHIQSKIKIPMMGDRPANSGLYLNLYHGRKDLSQDPDGWGSEGPLIGPLTRLKMTYLSCISLTFEAELDALQYGLDIDLPELGTDEDCVEYQGVFYGDWSLEYYLGMGEKQ